MKPRDLTSRILNELLRAQREGAIRLAGEKAGLYAFLVVNGEGAWMNVKSVAEGRALHKANREQFLDWTSGASDDVVAQFVGHVTEEPLGSRPPAMPPLPDLPNDPEVLDVLGVGLSMVAWSRQGGPHAGFLVRHRNWEDALGTLHQKGKGAVAIALREWVEQL